MSSVKKTTNIVCKNGRDYRRGDKREVCPNLEKRKWGLWTENLGAKPVGPELACFCARLKKGAILWVFQKQLSGYLHSRYDALHHTEYLQFFGLGSTEESVERMPLGGRGGGTFFAK